MKNSTSRENCDSRAWWILALEKRVTHIYNQNNGHLITGYIKKLEIYQNLNGQRHPDFECSSFQMVGTVAKAIAKARQFENQTI